MDNTVTDSNTVGQSSTAGASAFGRTDHDQPRASGEDGDMADDADAFKQEGSNVTTRHSRPRFQFERATWDVLDEVKHLNGKGEPISTTSGMFQSVNATTGEPQLLDVLTFQDYGVEMKYHYPASVVALLPADDVPSHRTCAVVGNSGGSLLKADGPFIGAHDAVFRVNLAPVEGYKDWVGEKSSYCVINAHNIKELLSSSGHIRRARRESKCDHMVLFESATSVARHSLLRPMLQKFPGTIALSPTFVNRCFRIWAQAQALFSEKYHKTYQRKPMSGFYTVMMALQMCESVDLFGFDAYTAFGAMKYHYFDNVEGFLNRHSFDFAYDLYKEFEKRGYVSVF